MRSIAKSVMRFLRDPAMQGASLILALGLAVLQFPQEISWLIPLLISFILLVFVGHRLAPDQSFEQSQEASLQVNTKSISKVNIISLKSFLRKWLLPGIVVLTFITSITFTVIGLVNKYTTPTEQISNNVRMTSVGLVERFSIEVISNTQIIHLKGISQSGKLLGVIQSIDPVILFTPDSEDDAAMVRFTGGLMVEDVGLDPENRVLEPTGHYIASDSNYQGVVFPLKKNHTLFVDMNDGKTVVRIYVIDTPDFKSPYSPDHVLEFYFSYTSIKPTRFDGLTNIYSGN